MRHGLESRWVFLGYWLGLKPRGSMRRRWFMTWRQFTAARALVFAADRMRDHWADGDQAAKRDLWRAVHDAADELAEALS